MYKKLIVYYFTGTGNAQAAAHWIAETAKANGLEGEVIRIHKDTSVSSYPFDKNTLVGFCFPTHGFNAPPIIIDFIKRFPGLPACQVFLLNTRAGMKLYKWFTPGLSGLALWWPAMMLRLKGHRIVGYQPLDLPSNWISFHPGLRSKVVDSIFQRCRRIVDRFANKILNGKKVYQAVWGIPLDLIVLPVSLLYYLFGRFALSKTYFASYKCNRCDKCIKECPVQAIRIIDDRPYWTYRCESCMHCMNHCPERAIETSHGFTALLWWIAFSSVPVLVMELLESYQILPEDLIRSGYKKIYYAVQFAFGMWIIFGGYSLMHYLLRYRWINYLITWTSLTKYRFWRRYTAPRRFLRKPINEG